MTITVKNPITVTKTFVSNHKKAVTIAAAATTIAAAGVVYAYLNREEDLGLTLEDIDHEATAIAQAENQA